MWSSPARTSPQNMNARTAGRTSSAPRQVRYPTRYRPGDQASLERPYETGGKGKQTGLTQLGLDRRNDPRLRETALRPRLALITGSHRIPFGHPSFLDAGPRFQLFADTDGTAREHRIVCPYGQGRTSHATRSPSRALRIETDIVVENRIAALKAPCEDFDRRAGSPNS